MPSKVNVYTKPGCEHCIKTKRLLDNLGIEYTKIDVTQDDAARAKLVDEWGFRAVPVVETEDDVWSGFRPERIKAIVG